MNHGIGCPFRKGSWFCLKMSYVFVQKVVCFLFTDSIFKCAFICFVISVFFCILVGVFQWCRCHFSVIFLYDTSAETRFFGCCV